MNGDKETNINGIDFVDTINPLHGQKMISKEQQAALRKEILDEYLIDYTRNIWS